MFEYVFLMEFLELQNYGYLNFDDASQNNYFCDMIQHIILLSWIYKHQRYYGTRKKIWIGVNWEVNRELCNGSVVGIIPMNHWVRFLWKELFFGTQRVFNYDLQLNSLCFYWNHHLYHRTLLENFWIRRNLLHPQSILAASSIEFGVLEEFVLHTWLFIFEFCDCDYDWSS